MYIVVYYVAFVDYKSGEPYPNRRRECSLFTSVDRATEFIENHLADADTDGFQIYEANELKYTTDITVTIRK